MVTSSDRTGAPDSCQAGIHIYDLKCTQYQDRTKATCVLLLPPLRDSAIILRSEVTVSSDPSSSFASHSSAKVPFYMSQRNKVFAITYRLLNRPLVLIIPLATIMGHLNTTHGDNGCFIPWDEWGPTGSRFIEPPWISPTWIRMAFGQKLVVCGMDNPGVPHFETVRVYNFNTFAIRHSLKYHETDNINCQTFTESSTIEELEFTSPVITSLPYQIWRAYLPLRDLSIYKAMMQSEDALVAVSVSNITL